MTYSRIPSPEETAEFFESIEAREARRAAKRAELSVAFGRVLRGRKREDHPEFLLERPTRLYEPAILYLQNRLATLGEPLTEQFSRSHRIPADPRVYERYVMSGKRRNSEEARARVAVDPTVQDRQIEHIADGAHRTMRDHIRTAQVRRHALLSVHHAIVADEPFSPEAAIFAGDALIDFAHSIRPLPPRWINYDYAPQMDERIEHIGTYVETDPEILRENPALITLVGKEQRKRIDYWTERYDVAVAADEGERIAADEVAYRREIGELIVSFGFDESKLPPIV